MPTGIFKGCSDRLERVDHFGLQSRVSERGADTEKERGTVAPAVGLHPIRVTDFDRTDGLNFKVHYAAKEAMKQAFPSAPLFHR